MLMAKPTSQWSHAPGGRHIWTATADDILAKVARGRVALENVS